MNRLAKWMMRLYPAHWRRRYGDEMDALLADSGADARGVANLAAGGVRMQFSTWSFPKLAVTLGLVGMLVGLGASFLITPVYRSSATLQVQADSEEQSPTQLNELIQWLQTAVLSRRSLSNLINTLNLYSSQRRTTPLEDIIDDMRRDTYVQIIARPGSLGRRASAFNIGFQYLDAAKAQQATAAMIDAFQSELAKERMRSLAGQPDNPGSARIEILDPASLPVVPIFPARWLPFASFFVTPRYESQTTLGVEAVSGQQSSTELNKIVQRLEAAILSRTSLAHLIDTHSLYGPQRRTMALGDVIDDMRKDISIRIVRLPGGLGKRASAFTIAFIYTDAAKAQQTTTAIAAGFESGWGGTLPARPPLRMGQLEILDPPSMPVNPVKPNRYTIAGIGFIFGVICSAVIAMVRRRWKPDADIPVDAVNG